MSPLAPGCPRCPTPVARVGQDGAWACPDHGTLRPLWRPDEAGYDSFLAHLDRADGFPTYLPWPLRPGWEVTDFAVVGDDHGASATLTCVSGVSDLDGPVDLLLVAEEAGVGLGARVAGTSSDDPGVAIGHEPPAARLSIGSQTVPLWPVATATPAPVAADQPHAEDEWDRSVLAGEAVGRWLWLVVRPASAVLMLQEPWQLRDVSGLGMALVELPFGGVHLRW